MAIYQQYYRCRREPFSLNPDPSFLYESISHRDALAELGYVIRERRGLCVLTGEVGTGKTMLLRSLLESVGSAVDTCFFFNPPHSSAELYETIDDELRVVLAGLSNPVSRLKRHLMAAYEKGRNLTLIFDEAQSIEPAMLEEIRLLTNLETASAKLVQVIIAGQPELDAVINSVAFRALRQRLAFRCVLKPLNSDDTQRYITARLAIAGAPRSLFTAGACQKVYTYSGGIPRLINVICDNALIAGYAMAKPLIEPSLIDEAAIDLRLRESTCGSESSGVTRKARRLKHYLVGRSSPDKPQIETLPQLNAPPDADSGYASRRWRRYRLPVFAVALAFLLVATVAATAAIVGHCGAPSPLINRLKDWLTSTLDAIESVQPVKFISETILTVCRMNR